MRPLIPRIGMILGPVPGSTSGYGYGTLSLNAAGTWIGYSFVAPRTGTLGPVMLQTGAVTGTQASIAGTCEIWTEGADGLPGAIIAGATATIPAGSWPAANAIVTFGDVTYPWSSAPTLTKGARYFVVLKNASAAPATNYMQSKYGTGIFGFPRDYSSATHGQAVKGHTTDSGSSWANPAANIAGVQGAMADGTPFGLLGANTYGTDSTNKVYGDRELGLELLTPPFLLPVLGVVTYVQKYGAPATSLVQRLYAGFGAGGRRIADGYPVAAASIATTQFQYVFTVFPSPVLLSPCTPVRVVITTSGGDASNYYRLHYADFDTTYPALLPCAGNLKSVYFDGSTYSTVTPAGGRLYPVGLVVDDWFSPQALGPLTAPGGF